MEASNGLKPLHLVQSLELEEVILCSCFDQASQNLILACKDGKVVIIINIHCV